MNAELRDDLQDLLTYSWHDEEADFADNPDDRHIFLAMQRLASFLDATSDVAHAPALFSSGTTETIAFQWSRDHGDCRTCGRPAAFYVPDAYGPTHPLGKMHKRCALCAANDAADGERVIWIEQPS